MGDNKPSGGGLSTYKLALIGATYSGSITAYALFPAPPSSDAGYYALAAFFGTFIVIYFADMLVRRFRPPHTESHGFD